MREQLGGARSERETEAREALEASYVTGPEDVEEPSYVTRLEYLVRRPLGAEALGASYFTGPAHVEEPSECLCLLTGRTFYEAAACVAARV